jgi:hypothetical protein
MGYREDVANYQAQVNAVRRQKQQEEYVADYNQAVYGREESLRARQEVERQVAVTTDPAEREALKDEWHMHDAEVQRCEQEIAARTPQQPQYSQRDIAFLQRKHAFRQKYGQAADTAIALAHRRAVTPRNPSATCETNPLTYGHGTQPGTPQYYRAVQAELETNAHLLGINYDPSEDAPGWKEIARASGLSEKDYTNAYYTLKRQGRVR